MLVGKVDPGQKCFCYSQPMETDSANFELELACAKPRLLLPIGHSQHLFESVIVLFFRFCKLFLEGIKKTLSTSMQYLTRLLSFGAMTS